MGPKKSTTTDRRACTECIRRKQKCNPGKGGPCSKCSRRYPPVECIRRPASITDAIEDNIEPSDMQLNYESKPEYHAQMVGESSRDLPVTHHHAKIKSHRSSSHNKGFSRTTKRNPISAAFDFYNQSFSAAKPNSNPKILSSLENAPYPQPKSFGGYLAAFSSLNTFHIETSSGNTELFHFFHQVVVPILASIDGQNTPPVFVNEVLPWMIQSPLMPKIALLTAAGSKALRRGVQPVDDPKSLAIKSNILCLINHLLRQSFANVYVDVMHSVIYLVVLEWHWGEHTSMWAHMNGIKEMIRLQGGFGKIHDPLLRRTLIVTDYELACSFERDLMLHQPTLHKNKASPIPFPYPQNFNSPLLNFSTPFVNLRESLELSLPVAEILDDVRLLTTSITSPVSPENDISSLENVATYAHDRIHSLPTIIITSSSTDTDLIYETCRIAAITYSFSIMTRTLFSHSYLADKEHRQDFFFKMTKVSLSRWKKIPGIFLWILLVACSSGIDTSIGMYLRGKLDTAAVSIAVEDFDVAEGCMRALWLVQRWIARQGTEEGREDFLRSKPTYSFPSPGLVLYKEL